MFALAASVLAASLIGSAHCAGMCGGLVVFCTALDGPQRTPAWLLHTAYNGGRLVCYVALGIAAGAIGQAVDLGGASIGVARSAAIVAGVIMVVFGIATLLRHRGVNVPALRLPGFVRRALGAGHRRAAKLGPLTRCVSVGLLTGLLPCGWLWAFLAIAAGTGSPAGGAVAMGAFWAGTLPALVAVGAGARLLAGRFNRVLPTATALLVIIAGLTAVLYRGALASQVHDAAHAAPVVSVQTALQSVGETDPSCCEEPDP